MSKIALVTASTKGIGKQIGLDLLEHDYFVYFNGHTQESTKKLENEIGLPDVDHDYLPSLNIICQDLSTIKSAIQLGNYLTELDILILNLGVTDRTPFGEIKSEEWNKVFETNLSSSFFLIQSLKDKIREGGKIIFISSISGIVPDSVSISYGVSKAGINMLVPYLAKEFASKGITVNAIAPGYTITDWHINKSKAQLKRISDKTLAKRFATTEEISSTVLHIIDNNYINGQVIRVDGGFQL